MKACPLHRFYLIHFSRNSQSWKGCQACRWGDNATKLQNYFRPLLLVWINHIHELAFHEQSTIFKKNLVPKWGFTFPDLILLGLAEQSNKVSTMFAGTKDKCVACKKTVYPIEKVHHISHLFTHRKWNCFALTPIFQKCQLKTVVHSRPRKKLKCIEGFYSQVAVDGSAYHKPCFKCTHGGCTISPSNYIAHEGRLYCRHHHTQLIKEKGNLSQLENEKPQSHKSAVAEIVEHWFHIFFEKKTHLLKNITFPVCRITSQMELVPPIDFQFSWFSLNNEVFCVDSTFESCYNALYATLKFSASGDLKIQWSSHLSVQIKGHNNWIFVVVTLLINLDVTRALIQI